MSSFYSKPSGVFNLRVKIRLYADLQGTTSEFITSDFIS